MANEIHADHASGSVLYAVIRNRQGQVWRPAGQAFESWGSGGHTADDYDSALTDKNGSRYVGNFKRGQALQAQTHLYVAARSSGREPAN
jgi:hypothetical protein